jgi:hypothetical protein
MRVFYIDEDDNQRRYYVKIDNLSVPDDLKGYKAIEAKSKDDLIEKIKLYFKIIPNKTIQLWTNSNYTGKRLDILPEIPKDCEFIYARVVSLNE